MEILNAHLTRQSDLIPMNTLKIPIKVIGAGAIGSFVALQAAKMGFEDIEVWDYDRVSIENMNCQFYRFKDIGKLKVEALADLVRDFTRTEIIINPVKYEAALEHRGIVVMAVDDMAARRTIFQDIQRKCFGVRFVIDSRMGSEDCLMYVMNPHDDKDVETYMKTLYTNENAVQERCTAKATIYTANLLSGMVTKAIKDIATGGKYPRITNWSVKNNQLLQWSKHDTAKTSE
jgi:molybdopterin/thiamine biosynthesis adenylyltransferase